MTLFLLFAACAVVLAVAYRTYGTFLMRWMRTDDRPTPARELEDGRDYVPAGAGVVTGQHFTAIAAAGPIVGPILAGLHFGWVPALLWILVGAVFIGGAHDAGALFASLRHRAASIVQVVRAHLSRPAYGVFLLFVWLSLVYVIIAFADLTASTFARVTTVELPAPAGGEPVREVVSGGGVASAAVAYLVVSVLLGVAFRRRWVPVAAGVAAGVVAVGAAIWLGPRVPLAFPEAWSAQATGATWSTLILAYCFLASVLPMWLLLQPRGLLGAVFLYAVLGGGVAGVVAGMFTGGNAIAWPAFKGWQSEIGPLMPFLFITVACGACSGFHAIVATGTTSKQVAREADVKPVAYGAMLLEAMVAVLALATVMVLVPGGRGGTPDAVFAQGLGRFLGNLGIPASFAVTFGLLAFSTFVFDTLDVCTRLGRYVFQELTGWKARWAGAAATAATLAFPVAYLLTAPPNAWRQFWTIFGTSNQLLAALTLVGLSVWFRAEGRRPWPVLVPACLMLVVTGTALVSNVLAFGGMVLGRVEAARGLTAFTAGMNLVIAVVLLALGVFVTWEAARVLRAPRVART